MQDYTDALNDAARDVPEDLAAWLGRLVLLYGVPLAYLVPDEAMLPKESLRFFFVDPVWVQHLVQGGLSVGSNGYGDSMIDRAMDGWMQPNQPAGGARSVIVNRAAAAVRDHLRSRHEGVAGPGDSGTLEWPLTGFLLRSGVVAGWRGLEVRAYRAVSGEERQMLSGADWTEEQRARFAQEGVAPLKPLRIEQLSPDLMLGIFNGVIAQLVIRQPQEALHFGVTREGAACTKSLRELGYANPSRAGERLPVEPLDLDRLGLMREAKGVVDIAALAERMRDVLSRSGDLPQDPAAHTVKFTSAEFAVQMIEGAGEFTFIAEPVPPS